MSFGTPFENARRTFRSMPNNLATSAGQKWGSSKFWCQSALAQVFRGHFSAIAQPVSEIAADADMHCAKGRFPRACETSDLLVQICWCSGDLTF